MNKFEPHKSLTLLDILRNFIDFSLPWNFRAAFLVFLLFFSSGFAGGTNSGSIFLLNDSPFILTATITAADGTFLGEFSVQPGQQKNFTQNLFATGYERPGKPEVSLTPYTVVWQCPSKGHYSMCPMVSPGSLVRANSCDGPRFCNPKQAAPEKPATTLEKNK